MKHVLLFLLLVISIGAQAQWQNLFNGSDFAGWNQKNGKAHYEVVDGQIVGTSVMNTPNSFLCTDKEYADFILEFDVWVDPSLNSGVQIRSLSIPELNNGRVHGYQVELDPSNRAWSTGIYDEARRGWLYPLSENPKGQHAFKNGQWNQVRVEAIGPHIRTWLNGIQCSNLVDDMTAKGFIGLQVHGIGKNEDKNGKQIIWKNIRIMTEDLEKHSLPNDPAVKEYSYLTNQLTEGEKRRGWRLLWDGHSTKGWRGAKMEDFPKVGWEIKEGVLTVLESGGGESKHGGDIITNDLFGNFELQVDFKITKGANSGIKYFVDPELNKGTGSAIGLEFQILDDVNHPDAKAGVGGNRTVGSLYDLIPAGNMTEPNRDTKRAGGPGSWNRARILVEGAHVEHWLNNVKVLEFERGSPIFRALVQKSKYKKWPNFGEHVEGYILLQEHGNTVHFKNIKVREF